MVVWFAVAVLVLYEVVVVVVVVVEVVVVVVIVDVVIADTFCDCAGHRPLMDSLSRAHAQLSDQLPRPACGRPHGMSSAIRGRRWPP